MPSVASKILMIRPAAFAYNVQTAESNSFQQADFFSQDLILEQFDRAVNQLSEAGIEVLVVDDEPNPPKPDAIFPNNWFTVLGGSFQLYPMFAPNRRLERRPELKEKIENFLDKKLHLIDWSHHEKQQQFLEGTGSLVIDRENKIVYASLSPRTDKELVMLWAKENGYTPFIFKAFDSNGQAIYHTNVVMGMGNTWAVICSECMESGEREKLINTLKSCGKEVVEITLSQMNSFAGNCMGLSGNKSSNFLIFSTTAWISLDENQQERLKAHGAPLILDVSEIERIGGGSIRCMIAELG